MSESFFTKPLVTFFEIGNDKAWKRYENEKGFLKFISPIDGKDFSNGSADVYVRDLPFYNAVQLLQVRSLDENGEPVYHFFLKYDSEYAQLYGNADVIHEVNTEDHVNISIDNAFDYLKFFNLFTANEDGNVFYIIEGQASEFLSDLSEYNKSRRLRKFSGSTVNDAQEMGVYVIDTRVLCAGALYNCIYEVNVDGGVEMISDEYVGPI